MEKSFLWCSTGLNFRPLLFLIYVSDLPLILERYSFLVLFADDISVVITVTNSTNFLSNSREIFSQLNTWFSAHLLLLNYDKTAFLQFRTKNSLMLATKLKCNNESADTKLDTKFLGIIMDSSQPYNGKIT
jgi:hypothetical protein